MKRLLIILAFLPVFGFGQYVTTDLEVLLTGKISPLDSTAYDSILGDYNANYKFINVDFDTSLHKWPSKSLASLVVGDDTIPLYALNSDGLRNYNRADTFFIQQENYNVLRIAKYSSAQVDVNNYFNELPEPINVSKVPGDYATINLAIASTSVNDTIEVYSGTYDEISYINWRYHNIRAVGNCLITSTGTSYVITMSNENTAFLSGFTIDGENTTGVTLFGSGALSNKNILNCGFKNSTGADLIFYTSTSTNEKNILFKNCVITGSNIINIRNNSNFNNCYLSNRITTSLALDRLYIDSCDIHFNKIDNDFLKTFGFADTVRLSYNNIYNFKGLYLVDAINTVLKASLDFSYNYVTTDSIRISNVRADKFENCNVNNNTFINNSFTNTTNFYTYNFRNLYIRDNLFITQTGNVYPIFVSSTETANEVYIEDNIDSSYSETGYFIRVGSELTDVTDNNILKTVIKGNIGYGLHYFSPASTPSIHGIFNGFNSDDIDISYNYLNGYGINYVFKGSTGTNSNNTKIFNNTSANSYVSGFYSKGVDSVKYYNNTSYNDPIAFYFTENTGGDSSVANQVINNLIENSGYAYSFDVPSSNNFISYNNVVYSDNIANYNSTIYNWANWQALGYDANSFNTDPNLSSSTQLWPVYPSDAIEGGVDLGPPYNQGLDISSTWPNDINLIPRRNPPTIGAYEIYKKRLVKQNNKLIKYGNKLIKY